MGDERIAKAEPERGVVGPRAQARKQDVGGILRLTLTAQAIGQNQPLPGRAETFAEAAPFFGQLLVELALDRLGRPRRTGKTRVPLPGIARKPQQERGRADLSRRTGDAAKQQHGEEGQSREAEGEEPAGHDRALRLIRPRSSSRPRPTTAQAIQTK